jgi:hypothetical protein
MDRALIVLIAATVLSLVLYGLGHWLRRKGSDLQRNDKDASR